MKTKHIVILTYLALGVLTAIYGSIWGDYNYKSLAYHIGRGLVWPAVWFPIVGQIISVLVVLGFALWATFSKRN